MSSATRPRKSYLGTLGTWILGGYLAAIGVLIILALAIAWGAETGTPAQPEPPSKGMATTTTTIPAAPITTTTLASPITTTTPAAVPSVSKKPSEAGEKQKEWKWWWKRTYRTSVSIRLLLIVMLAGGLGSWLHAMSSFLAFVGNRKFVTSWTAWYVGRPIVGAALALIVYFLLRGGLLPSQDPDALNDYGFAAFAALVGLFTDRATNKLREVFDVIFAAAEHEDPLGEQESRTENPQPEISGIEPQSVAAGSTDTTIAVSGKGFVSGSTVTVAGAAVERVEMKGDQLVLTLPSAKLATPGDVVVTVTNPEPGGGVAEAILKVVAG